MNRRVFCTAMGTIGYGSLIASTDLPFTGWRPEIHRPIFDLHIHVGEFFRKGSPEYKGDGAFVERVGDMRLHKVSGAFFSIVSDLPLLRITDRGVVPHRSLQPGEGWRIYQHQLSHLKSLFSDSDLEIATGYNALSEPSDLQCYISCEGGDFLDGSIDHLETAYEDGVRSIQLVHYAPNLLGDLQTWKETHGGLSDLGREVVKKMNELGMIIDVAHASARTVKNVADLTTAPIILSHSILQDSHKSPVSSRAISPDHARLVSSTGGVIGIWPSGFSPDLNYFADATLKMIDAVGIDHVGIGTDMDANFRPVIKNYADFTMWIEFLENRGLSTEEVNKVSGGNAMRVIKSVLAT